MSPRANALIKTEAEWRQWAIQRKSDAPKIARTYEKQARDVETMLTNHGCNDCDPRIVMTAGEHGGPTTDPPQVIHDLFCITNNS